jgi:hypothetical protein
MAALVLVVHLLYLLLAIAMGDGGLGKVRRAVGVLLAVMLLMVATRLRLSGRTNESSPPLASGPGCVSIDSASARSTWLR